MALTALPELGTRSPEPNGGGRRLDCGEIMRTMLLTTLVTLALTACGGAASQVAAVSDTTTTSGVETTTSEEQPVATEPGYDAELSAIVEQVRADLAARLEVEESSIEVLSAELVTWPDGSLGCPQPGMFYTQALVEGSRVLLRSGETTYPYHAGDNGEPFLCESEEG